MGNDVLIRDVPDAIMSWLKCEQERQLLSQKELLLAILEDRYESERAPKLFDTHAPQFFRTAHGLPFKFAELFAGIGGLRLGLTRAGGCSVFAAEENRHCRKTYHAWFGDMPHSALDILDPMTIPDHDVLAARLPCERLTPDSSDRLDDGTRDSDSMNPSAVTAFAQFSRVVEAKRPPVFVFEGAKNLRSHDRGRTWKTIRSRLDDQLGYWVFAAVIDAADYVPQHRPRTFVVGFDRGEFVRKPAFSFPMGSGQRHRLADILCTRTPDKYTLSDRLWTYLQRYREQNEARGNGFGYDIADRTGVTRMFSSRYHKDGSDILIAQNNKNPRRLVPREAARLMGFPDRLPIVVSDTQAYKQFGHAVVPDIVEAIAEQIMGVVASHLERYRTGCLLKNSTTEATSRIA